MNSKSIEEEKSEYDKVCNKIEELLDQNNAMIERQEILEKNEAMSYEEIELLEKKLEN